MFRIETAVPYPTDYNEAAYGVAKKQHEEGTKIMAMFQIMT